MRSIFRRVAIGAGSMLIVAGIGLYLVGHDALRYVISFNVEDPAAREKVFGAFGAAVFLAAIGAGILMTALPRIQPKASPASA